MIYLYERVSTVKQDEWRQELAISHYKIDKKYIDKCSGKNIDRPELNKLIIDAKAGDTIYGMTGDGSLTHACVCQGTVPCHPC